MSWRSPSLRGLFFVIAVVAFVWVAGIAVYLAFGLLPASEAMDGQRPVLVVDDSGGQLQGAPDSGDARRATVADLVARETALAERARTAARVVAAWLVLGLALAVVAWVVLQRRLYAPLEALERGLERVAAGDYGVVIGTGRSDELGRLASIYDDMTGQLLESTALEEQRRADIAEKYGRILTEAAIEMYEIDAAGLRFIQASASAYKALDLAEDALRRRTVYDQWDLHPGSIEPLVARMYEGERDSVILHTEQRRADGSGYPVEIHLHAAPQATPPVLLALVTDLSERRRLEEVHDKLARFALEKARILQSGELSEALDEVTATAATTLGVARASVWFLDGGTLRCQSLHANGVREPVDGLEFLEEDVPRYFRSLREARTIAADDVRVDSRTRELEDSYFAPMGITSTLDAPIWVDGEMKGVICHEHIGDVRIWTTEEMVFAGAMADFVSRAWEVHERRTAERAHRDSEEQYRTAFEEAAVGMAEFAVSGRVLRANALFCEMLGHEPENIGALKWVDLVVPDDVASEEGAFQSMLDGGRPNYHREVRYRHSNGSHIWVKASSAPVRRSDGPVERFLTIVQDVSAERSLRTQLTQSQKMDSIGRLAGGIAHDFNNLLTAILGTVELAKEDVDPAATLHEDLEEIEGAALRATDLTQQLLTFARRGAVEPRVIDVNAKTLGTEKLLRRLIGAQIDLRTDITEEELRVRIDPGQFEQVIVNLAVNARDAMPDGGVLSLEVSAVESFEETCIGGHGPAGPCVVLRVTDNGAGIPEEIHPRLFEPFFTTKGPGRGTGLGLATSYGIVVQAGGAISMRTEVGVGTTFSIALPRTEERLDALASSQSSTSRGKGGEVILVVEDEDGVRNLIDRTLTRAGYEVLTAIDGEKALETIAERGNEIAMVITDVVMPRMGGDEVASLVREAYPDMRILFISGYSESEKSRQTLSEAGRAFLPKPFSTAVLGERVRGLLDGTLD